MRKSSKIILASVLTIGVAGGVFAFGAHHHYSSMTAQEKAEMISDRIDRKLDLTEYQKQNLDALTKHLASLMQQIRENQQVRSDLLGSVLSDGPVDQANLLQKIADKTALVNSNAPEVVARLAGFVDSLDNEQKAKIRQMVERRRGHRFGHHHGGHGFPE